MTAPSGQQPDLFKCIEKWVGGLTDSERVQIIEIWLEVDAKHRRLDSHADRTCMLESYSRLAPLLKSAGVLTKDIVELKLPELIWELAMAVGRVDVHERHGHQESRLRRFEGLRQVWRVKLEHSTPKTEGVLDSVQAGRCDPLLWRHFSYEKTSKTSKCRESLINNFVSLTVPAHRTNRDVVEQIAKESHIPIESLSDDLNQPVFPRGQAIFGFAGDEFDTIADHYDNMQWWLSDNGLNMPTIVIPALAGGR